MSKDDSCQQDAEDEQDVERRRNVGRGGCENHICINRQLVAQRCQDMAFDIHVATMAASNNAESTQSKHCDDPAWAAT